MAAEVEAGGLMPLTTEAEMEREEFWLVAKDPRVMIMKQDPIALERVQSASPSQLVSQSPPSIKPQGFLGA